MSIRKMSRNLSARSGDGDAASNDRKELNTNGHSGSSSYRGRTDDEILRPMEYLDFSRNVGTAGLEGPYGDSPPEHQKQYRKEYLILMLNENDGSTPTSDYEQDRQLYNLRNDYLHKLNIVRRKLNLVEINDESNNSTYRGGCRIREVMGETPSEVVLSHPQNATTQENTTCSFHFNYGNFSKSKPTSFELEYTPPKKKTCQREETPRLSSSVESKVAYHTEISMKNDLSKSFANFSEKAYHTPSLWTNTDNKFTKNEETQCSIEPIISNQCCQNLFDRQDSTISQLGNDSSNNDQKNLFPEVIVKKYPSRSISSSSVTAGAVLFQDNQTVGAKEENIKHSETHFIIQKTEAYYRVTSPSKSVEEIQHFSPLNRTNSFIMDNPPNFIEESTDENYDTGTTSTTTILEKSLPNASKTLWRSIKKKQKKSFWGDLRRMQPERLQGGGELGQKQYLANKERDAKKFSYQSSGYKIKGIIKSRKNSDRRRNVPFGPRALVNGAEQQYLENKYYYFNSDTDYNSSVFNSESSPREQKIHLSCWDGILQWLSKLLRPRK